jgi:UDP-N-acetylmuramoyl-L-alanyl-D-glutamate--2,6-diaminopimelate ligase
MHCLHTPQAAAQWLHAMAGESFLGEHALPKASLQTDSRAVQAGDIFLAYAGQRHDARPLVIHALDQGARACLVDLQDVDLAPNTNTSSDSSAEPDWNHIFPGLGDASSKALAQDVRVAFMPQLKASRGWVAAEYYGNPSRNLKVLAVTGTNGKTTCTWWLAQVLAKLGKRCALAGTLGLGELELLTGKSGPHLPAQYHLKALPSQKVFGSKSTGGLTTFEANELQHAMRHCYVQGFTHMALEASSIGLSEGRLGGTQIEVAVLTNLTQDHLDYHGDMNSYWQAKRTLFVQMNPKAMVINLDDAHGLGLYLELTQAAHKSPDNSSAPVIVAYTSEPVSVREALVSAGLDAEKRMADILCARNVQFKVLEGSERLKGSEGHQGAWVFDLAWRGHLASLELHVLGRYNVSNALAVMGTLLSLGVEWSEALAHCQELQAVSGRMQLISNAGTPNVVVDYAHTPDALSQVLSSLLEITQPQGAKLWCVMGCGGDRDRTKRGLMGRAAEALADHVVLTSDNPRHENPISIIEDIESGMLGGKSHRQIDRKLAIEWALSNAAPEDWVLVAGKGHENYQEIDGVRLPFSDQEVVANALALESEKRRQSKISTNAKTTTTTTSRTSNITNIITSSPSLNTTGARHDD